MRMLVVDPNVAFATLLTEELTRLGHDVTACYSGGDAFSTARREDIDLALLDMGLEDPDAITLARDLRGLDPATRLMLIPMMGEEPALGPDVPEIQGVLPKPFFMPELPERIDAALSKAVPTSPVTGRIEDVIPDRMSQPSRARAAEPAPSPVTAAPVEAPVMPADKVADLDDATDDQMVISLRSFRANQGLIESLMRDLAREVGADGVLLTSANGLLTAIGTLDEDEIDSISRAVLQGWQTSAEMARILGREQVRFEQSITGGSYMLYALNVREAILALTVDGSAPLGLLRLRSRATGERIAELCSAS